MNTNSTDSGKNPLRLLSPVLRARDFHLYLEGGRRLVDLWQMGGKAVLGHKPSRTVSELKNAAERGLFAPLPHPAEQRFLKALARLFRREDNRFSFRIYENDSSLLKSLENSGFIGEKITVWRPFDGKENFSSAFFKPILPWAFSPSVLAINLSAGILTNEKIPQGDLLSPAILAPAARTVYDLLAAGEYGGRPRFPRIEKALASSAWSRSGIYLTFNSAVSINWPDLWNRFLEQGFLLPPSPSEPLILPAILSQGEETKLAELLNEKDYPRISTTVGAAGSE